MAKSEGGAADAVAAANDSIARVAVVKVQDMGVIRRFEERGNVKWDVIYVWLKRRWSKLSRKMLG